MRAQLLFTLIAAFLLLPSSSSSQETPRQRPLKVGMIYGLSAGGVFASVSLEMQKGMEIARAEAGAYPMEFVFDDDGGAQIKNAVRAAGKLIDVDKVDVLLNWGYSTAPAVAPVCNRAKVPCVVIWDSNEEAHTLGPYNFSVGMATEASGAKLAAFAYENLGLRNIAAISASDHWSELMSKSFQRAFRSQGGQILLHESIPPDATDVKALIMRARQGKADGLFLPLYATSMHSSLRQARELGFSGKILAGDSILESDLT